MKMQKTSVGRGGGALINPKRASEGMDISFGRYNNIPRLERFVLRCGTNIQNLCIFGMPINHTINRCPLLRFTINIFR